MSTPDFSAPVSGHRKCFQSGAARSFEVAGEAVDRLAGDDERPRRAPMDVLPRTLHLAANESTSTRYRLFATQDPEDRFDENLWLVFSLRSSCRLYTIVGDLDSNEKD